eukprot:TRINITY_DN33328_c0_g1_i2.p1 TRINITY_DN33328_c0_g1~~TRINITY_DN33328_c0_g1_i2.p1  ORF type:complete len:159 (-),score=50.10 TRINITY_DN33328_c0_g1_i2:208-684(-)
MCIRDRSTLEDQSHPTLIETRQNIEDDIRRSAYHRGPQGWDQEQLEARLAATLEAGFFPKDLMSTDGGSALRRRAVKRKPGDDNPNEQLKKFEAQEKSGEGAKGAAGEEDGAAGEEELEVEAEGDDALDWNNEVNEVFDDDEDMDDVDEGGDDEGGTF